MCRDLAYRNLLLVHLLAHTSCTHSEGLLSSRRAATLELFLRYRNRTMPRPRSYVSFSVFSSSAFIIINLNAGAKKKQRRELESDRNLPLYESTNR